MKYPHFSGAFLSFISAVLLMITSCETEGYIELSDDQFVSTVEDPILTISTNKIIKTGLIGDTIEVCIKTNIPYDVKIPKEFSSWLTTNKAKPYKVGEELIKVCIGANNTFSSRKSFIVITSPTDSNVRDSIYITQEGLPELFIVKERRIETPYEGATYDILCKNDKNISVSVEFIGDFEPDVQTSPEYTTLKPITGYNTFLKPVSGDDSLVPDPNIPELNPSLSYKSETVASINLIGDTSNDITNNKDAVFILVRIKVPKNLSPTSPAMVRMLFMSDNCPVPKPNDFYNRLTFMIQKGIIKPVL